jgi:hypothetical protein
MSKEIEEKISEFAEISQKCPEKLQEKCFEILLSKYLDSHYSKEKKTPKQTGEEKQTGGEGGPTQDDLTESDLHIKARSFLKTYSLELSNINRIFYKEGDAIHSLYDDLKSTKASENQLRIALLGALKNGIKTGNFEFNGEDVRAECIERKCYDIPNFATIFKNSKDLFEGFEKYKKASPTIRLSANGKKKLAELIKELQ